MPVEINSFTASVLSNTVKLSWTTGQKSITTDLKLKKEKTLKDKEQNPEIKNQEFPWAKIGFVKEHGNSNSPKKYNF